MTDRPIIFNAMMVRALLDGRKTQTRRPLTLRGHKKFSEFGRSDTPGYDWTFRDARLLWNDLTHKETIERLQPALGDRLWVRETWSDDDAPPGEATYRATVAEDASLYPDEIANITWTPSIHMPRWASRLTLIVTDVRLQRLHDISEEDAIAEGIEFRDFFGCPCWTIYGDIDGTTAPNDPIASYASLWNHCYGPGAWDENPWVVATTFTTHHRNIDKMGDE